MTSRQSTLGGNTSIAEDLADGQRSISIAEFFEKNKHMLGFDSPGRSIVTAVKEAVDNALDATEEAGILPHITVDITQSGDYYNLVIEDNGPGITKEQIPKVFGSLLYGSRFHSRQQSRGQQGIGISAAVLYSQQTSGKPAKVTSKTENHEQAQYFELVIDTDTNEPEIRTNSETNFDASHDDDHGTRIELEMEANMRARQQLHNYIEYTAVVNPHATITLTEPGLDEPMHFERVTEEMPDETEEILPHPHGVELGTLQKMLADTDSHSLSGFLQSEFTRVGQKSAQSIIDAFMDRWHGRELAVPVPDDTSDLEAAISDSIHNKGVDATEGFVDRLLENIDDAEHVTRSELSSLIADAADNATDTFGKTFGATVRSNAADAAWGVLEAEAKPFLTQTVNEATSTRKRGEEVATIAAHLTAALRAASSDFRFTRATLADAVSRAAHKTETDEDLDVRFGDTARENIVDAIWEATQGVDEDAPLVRKVSGNRDMEQKLLEAMESANLMSPPTDCLAPISEELIIQGMKKVYNADFYASATRDADAYSGEPFIAEAGIAYGGDLEAGGNADLLRFANRVPLVYQEGACAITDTVKDIGWRNYKVSQSGGHGLPNDEPMVILVHVASTNVPFTSESKDALASVEIIETEIERAVREAARELKSHLTEQEKLEERRKKQNVIADLLPEMAEKAAQVSGAERAADVTQSLARIMNSVVVRPDNEELTLENYTNTAESFSIKLHFDEEKPTYPSNNAERRENGDGWDLVWEGSLDDGESATITWNSDETPEVTPIDIADAKVSYSNTDHIQ